MVQGITEFLPISSSGHLVLIHDFIAIDTPNTLALEGMLHLATTLAVVLYFWSDIWTLLQAMLRRLGRLPVNKKDITLFYALLLGTIPAVILGLVIQPYISGNLQSTNLVASALFAASIFFMYAEWRYYTRSANETVTPKTGLMVGLFQALALLPGFSRSGATIAGGMLMGMSRLEATRFSFLLAIPIMIGVSARNLLGLITNGGSVDWTPVLAGCFAAFVSALIVIHSFLSFIRRYTLWPFIWYGLILACLVGYVSLIS